MANALTFTLSTAQKKRAHTWRHAAQRVKTIKPVDGSLLPPYAQRKQQVPSVPPGEHIPSYRDAFDDWLRAKWDALHARASSFESVSHGLEPIELALMMYHVLDSHFQFASLIHHTYTELVHLAKEPRQGAIMILDAVAELATIRTHYSSPPTLRYHKSRAFTYSEGNLAIWLRKELCWYSDEDYEAVLAYARNVYGTRDEIHDMFLAMLFPSEQSWGNLAIERIIANARLDLHSPDATGYDSPAFALATGADIDHVHRLFDAGCLTSSHHKVDVWNCLLDMAVTHDADAIPILIALLDARDGGPSLDESALQPLCLSCHEDDVLEALMRRLLHSYLSSKSQQKCLKHLAEHPEVVLERLPAILDDYVQQGHAEDKDLYVALSLLLERTRSQREAVELVEHDERERVNDAEIPPQLKQLPWHGKKKLPKLPEFWRPLTYPDLLIKRDPALRLPRALYDDIGRVMMGHEDEALATAMSALRHWIDETSLSQFVWHMMRDWLEVNAPAKHMWVFEVFLELGSSDLVRELPSLMDYWISSKFHKRGRAAMEKLEPKDNPYMYEALDAMMHGAYSDAAELARERLASFAKRHAEQDLSIHDLLDAVAPRLGLSPEGKLEIDANALIEVRFDRDLEPRLDAPRGEDIELSKTATLQWNRLKIRQQQLAQTMARRFEYAMTTQRRWTPRRWQEYILAHPLLSGVAQRLIWGIFDEEGRLSASWRIDESREVVDVDDVILPQDKLFAQHLIGILHPIQLDETQRAAWSTVCADYEIIQPFEQIERPFYPEPVDHAEWLALHGKRASHDRLHEMFMRNRWEATPYHNISTDIKGYGLCPKLADGGLASKEFKFEVEGGIRKDPGQRASHFVLEKCVNLKRLPWATLDPIDRSELYYTLATTFTEEP